MERYFHTTSELQRVKHLLADLLLQYARTAFEGHHGLSQQEIGDKLGISRDIVRSLLILLQSEGAIRIERHRLFVNQSKMEQIATEPFTARTYGLLRARVGSSEQAVSIMRCQPGVIMTDWVEGLADVIFAIQASDRESLAELVVQAISAVESVTEEVQLLPAR